MALRRNEHERVVGPSLALLPGTNMEVENPLFVVEKGLPRDFHFTSSQMGGAEPEIQRSQKG